MLFMTESINQHPLFGLCITPTIQVETSQILMEQEVIAYLAPSSEMKTSS